MKGPQRKPLRVKYWALAALFPIHIPLTFPQWTQVHFSDKSSPKFETLAKTTDHCEQWSVKTANSTGGYVYRLEAPVPLTENETQVSWNWSVTKFPTIVEPLFEKRSDDFALRVGILVSDGHSSIQEVRRFTSRPIDVSYVIFFDAYPKKIPETSNCGLNPYLHRAADCFLLASPKTEHIELNPYGKIRSQFKLSEREMSELRIVGFWIDANSDNSKSSSDATFSDLQLTSRRN